MRGVLKILAAVVVALISFGTYWCSTDHNEVTGENQRVAISPKQEIAIGLQAAPQMAQQYGGLSADPKATQLVKQIGQQLVQSTAAASTEYAFDFHLLEDDNVVNAFALPGGQIFITEALLNRLQNIDQLAGVLGHEIGHVVARHSAEQMAKQKLAQGLTGAAVMATYDPTNPATTQTAAVAQMVGQLVNMKYGRDDELESDDLGVRFMLKAGYDPQQMIEVMNILEQASGGGGGRPEFASTHPDPANRREKIKQAIAKYSAGL